MVVQSVYVYYLSCGCRVHIQRCCICWQYDVYHTSLMTISIRIGTRHAGVAVRQAVRGRCAECKLHAMSLILSYYSSICIRYVLYYQCELTIDLYCTAYAPTAFYTLCMYSFY